LIKSLISDYFFSNIAGGKIKTYAQAHHNSGKSRDDISLDALQEIIKKEAFNLQGTYELALNKIFFYTTSGYGGMTARTIATLSESVA
jgi:hypothetical protein